MKKILIILCCLLLSLPLCAAPLALAIQLSASETNNDDVSSWDYAWSLQGKYVRPAGNYSLNYTIESDYVRSADRIKTDRLKSVTRLIRRDKSAWAPVVLLQSLGDHDCDTTQVLAAAGVRYSFSAGFIEATTGVSKDVITSDPWRVDTGMEFGMEQHFGSRLSLKAGPKLSYTTGGTIRTDGEQMRYDLGIRLQYELTEQMAIGYRFWQGNTTPTADRTQWLGINFKIQ